MISIRNKELGCAIALLFDWSCQLQIHTTTIENQRSGSVKIYFGGDLAQPVIQGMTTKKLDEKIFAQGAIEIVAKSAKDETELWRKGYCGKEMDEIQKGDKLHFVIPSQITN